MEDKKIVDETLKVEFKKSEIFQLYLCCMSRIGYAQQKWACSASEQEQKFMQNELVALTTLSKKLSDLINTVV